MIYTLSKADFDAGPILDNLTEQDAVVLWQNGVLQAVKNPQKFAKYPNVFVLETDLTARDLKTDLKVISMEELVDITEKFYPQVAL